MGNLVGILDRQTLLPVLLKVRPKLKVRLKLKLLTHAVRHQPQLERGDLVRVGQHSIGQHGIGQHGIGQHGRSSTS
ncbi:MAG: hypothetical protein ACYDC9_13015 [Dermatophilaceae bacterium]